MSAETELTAAGIADPALRAAYTACRALHARHGRTYFLATGMLEPRRRPAVHALYGFARHADDIVDDVRPTDPPAPRLAALRENTRSALAGARGLDPIVTALCHTVRHHGIEPTLFDEFLDAMAADLVVTDFPDRAALYRYVRGSADVIGLMMLPVLGSRTDAAEAAPYAAALGRAFQLTNFCRDVSEDLGRGRIYLPADELAAFDVDRDRLEWCRTTARTDAKVRAALADQLARTRAVYREARPGIAMLDPRAQPCIHAADVLYSEILDRIEEIDYAVFAQRARVPRTRKARVAAAAWVRAQRTRRAAGSR